MTKYVV